MDVAIQILGLGAASPRSGSEPGDDTQKGKSPKSSRIDIRSGHIREPWSVFYLFLGMPSPKEVIIRFRFCPLVR